MPDSYNVRPGDDKLSQYSDYTGIEEDLLTEQGRNRSTLGTCKYSTQDLYDQGIESLERIGFKVKRSIQGPYAYHHIYQERPPEPIKGIKYPSGFSVYLPLAREADYGLLQNHLLGLENGKKEDVADFWQPLVIPDPRKAKRLYGHTLNLIKMDEYHRDTLQTVGEDLGICLDGNNQYAAHKWIPPREWFDKNLHQVSLADIFTIFPPVEQEMLALLLGRIVVGKSGNVHCGHTKAISHTSRMAGVAIGDPGLGKSTLFNALLQALGRVGYSHSTFRKLSDRFNLSDVALSDVAYKDDTVNKSLADFLETENTKILITNGKLKVEFKGVDAFYVPSYPVLLLNANEFNPRVVFGIDPGTAARVKFLATYRMAEIKTQERNPLIADSPDLRPFTHLPWLCDKLGVSQDALMLWALRLSADKFLEVIQPTTDGTNGLENKVNSISINLRQQHYKLITRQFMTMVVLIMMLNSAIFSKRALHSLSAIPWDLVWRVLVDWTHHTGTEVRKILLRLAKESENPDHPAWILKHLEPASIVAARNKWKLEDSLAPRLGKGQRYVLEESFKELYTRSGFPLSHDYIWLNSNFEYAVHELESLEQIKTQLISDPEWEQAVASLYPDEKY